MSAVSDSDFPPPEGRLIKGVFDDRVVELEKKLDRETRRWLDWPVLSQADAPEYQWLIDHWLGWHPTLLSGRGSAGKTLLAQQLGTALALGCEFLGPAREPIKVLMWACEDDESELWRRQERICKALGASLGDLQGNLWIDARLGLHNELFGLDHGKPGWSGAYGELIAQIEETQADLLILDNIGHAFGGNENSRHDVTTFCSGIAGLVPDRRFASILIGHIAKANGSEYAGSTAWENAVRMRWYMGDKLPDQPQGEDEEIDTTIRYLSKRKANYTALDYVRMAFHEGALKLDAPELDTDSPLIHGLRTQRAQSIVLASIERLAIQGRHGTDTTNRYLPKLIIESGWADGHTKTELRKAMMRLLGDGKITKIEVGKDSKYRPISGLIVTPQL